MWLGVEALSSRLVQNHTLQFPEDHFAINFRISHKTHPNGIAECLWKKHTNICTVTTVLNMFWHFGVLHRSCASPIYSSHQNRTCLLARLPCRQFLRKPDGMLMVSSLFFYTNNVKYEHCYWMINECLLCSAYSYTKSLKISISNMAMTTRLTT